MKAAVLKTTFACWWGVLSWGVSVGAQPQGIFLDVQPLDEPVNSRSNDQRPSISSDDLTLYFQSNRPGGRGDTDLYRATRDRALDDEGNPVPFGDVVNLEALNTASADGGPSISSDGRSLYFHSSRPGGAGGDDLWVARRAAVDGPFAVATNLGSAVNTVENELLPSIAVDELTLFFATQRPDGFGNLDVHKATRERTTDDAGDPVPFDHVENLGAGVNGPAVDGRSSISHDGLTLFFNSNPLGLYDNYMASRGGLEEAFENRTKIAGLVNGKHAHGF